MKKALAVFTLLLASTGAGCVINLKSSDESGKIKPPTDGKPSDDSTKTPSIGQVPQVLAANEIAAMARLRSIATAEAAYYAEGDGKYATLDELVQMGIIHDPAQGKLRGYSIEVRVKPNGYEATAVPEKYRVTGMRSFYLDETGVMRGSDKEGAPANSSDPILY